MNSEPLSPASYRPAGLLIGRHNPVTRIHGTAFTASDAALRSGYPTSCVPSAPHRTTPTATTPAPCPDIHRRSQADCLRLAPPAAPSKTPRCAPVTPSPRPAAASSIRAGTTPTAWSAPPCPISGTGAAHRPAPRQPSGQPGPHRRTDTTYDGVAGPGEARPGAREFPCPSRSTPTLEPDDHTSANAELRLQTQGTQSLGAQGGRP